MAFDEKKHPRDSDGKFTDGNGGSERNKIVVAISKYSSDPTRDLEYSNLPSAKRIADSIPKKALERQDVTSSHEKSKPQDEFFGEEFTGIKGADAIEKLLKEKRGHVKNAFERPEIGGIDLVWGDETGGLQHTIMRRDEQLKAGTGATSGVDIARKIPEIIEKGKFSFGVGDRPNFTYSGYLVVIRPAFDGNKVNWVLTAMEPQRNQ